MLTFLLAGYQIISCKGVINHINSLKCCILKHCSCNDCNLASYLVPSFLRLKDFDFSRGTACKMWEGKAQRGCDLPRNYTFQFLFLTLWICF